MGIAFISLTKLNLRLKSLEISPKRTFFYLLVGAKLMEVVEKDAVVVGLLLVARIEQLIQPCQRLVMFEYPAFIDFSVLDPHLKCSVFVFFFFCK